MHLAQAAQTLVPAEVEALSLERQQGKLKYRPSDEDRLRLFSQQ